LSGAGVVQPLAPNPVSVATVQEPDELKLLEIQAIIDGLNACLLVFGEPEKSETEKIIKGLEALKSIAV